MNLLEFLQNGPERRRKLDEAVGNFMTRITPPNLRPAAEFVAEANPVQAQMGAMQAGSVVFDPEQTAEARKRAALDMGVEMAFALTPTVLARMGYLTPVQGVVESLVGGSPAQEQIKEDAGRIVADATGLGRGLLSGDKDVIGEVFQRGGEPQSVGAARVVQGSDYFDPPRNDGTRAVDPALKSPFSSNVKQKTAPYNWSAQSETLETLNKPTLVRPEDHAGARHFFAVGDRTAGDVMITKIGDVTLRRPVKMEAGAEFMDKFGAWASHSNVLKPKQKVFENLGDEKETILAFAPMGERSGDFAKHQGRLFAEFLYSSNIPKKSVKVLDRKVKELYDAEMAKRLEQINKARKKDGLKPVKAKKEKVPSVASEEFQDWFAQRSPEQVAKPFIQFVDKAAIKNLDGVPDVGEVRFAATNPDLISSDTLSTGYRFARPDFRKGLLGSSHESYDTQWDMMEGTGSETFGVQLPWIIGARNTALPRLKQAAIEGGYKFGQNFPTRDYALPSEQRVFTMNPNTFQDIDNQYVDEASTYIDTVRNHGQDFADMYARGLLDDFLRKD